MSDDTGTSTTSKIWLATSRLGRRTKESTDQARGLDGRTGDEAMPLSSSQPITTMAPPLARSSGGSTTPGTSSHSSSSSSRRAQRPHHEDLLVRTWRSIAHSVVQVSNKAEKVAAQETASRETVKELNEATVRLLGSRLEWSRSISHLEAELEGKAAEMEALQQYVRCQPKIGKRKRGAGGAEDVVDDATATATAEDSSTTTTPAARAPAPADESATKATS